MFSKDPVCTFSGLDCFNNQEDELDKCIQPCEGIYADIMKENVKVVDKYTPGMKNLVEAYEKYKNLFLDDIEYPPALSGIAINICYTQNIKFH